MSRKDINLKLIAASLLGIIILVTIVLSYICNQYFITMLDSQKNQLMVISQGVATALETSIARNQQDVEYLLDSNEYQKSEIIAFDENDDTNFVQMLKSYQQTHSSYVADILVYSDSFDKPVISLKHMTYEKVSDVDVQDKEKVSLWKNPFNQMYMSIESVDGLGYNLCVMVDLDKLYDTVVSYITIGDKGYVMVKDSNATIIMHKLSNQLGINAIDERQSLYPNLNIDNKSLEEMINNQKSGKEGIEIYKSYWWADENPKLIKKITAYTPANVGDGFLIVSAVMDYNAVAGLIINDVMKIVILAVVIVILIAGLMILIVLYAKKRNKIVKENEYLRELNESLQTLHENELIMAHQQQLQIIGTMTGGIAHEFNNLLTPIMGYAGLMLSTMEETNQYYNDVSEIYDSSEKAKEIIQQISSLSKRNMDTIFKYVDITNLLNRVKKMADSIKPPNIDVQVETQDTEYGIFGNATQLNQVVLNLIVNAFYAIGSNSGTVIIGDSKLTREQLETSGNPMVKDLEKHHQLFAKIFVKDNGSGMDEAVLSRIFDPFFTTKGSEGTGLGLSIVQNIVTSHKGIIYAESKVGEGTSFNIIIPVTDKLAEQPEIQKETHIKEQLDKIRILVVEDNPKVLKMLEKGLKSVGYEVTAISNPLVVLKLIRDKHEFDIVITDDSMKEMSGIQLAMHIRQQYQKIPIVVLTGMLRKEIIEAKQSLIIEEYMVKPISINNIVEVVNTFFKKS